MQRNATPRPARQQEPDRLRVTCVSMATESVNQPLKQKLERVRALSRAALLATTGLSALVLPPGAARAQSIAADTTPQGGSVAAGSAAITQAPGSTTINQNSARTVINWQSFNVGSAASVRFNQPSASAIALNRVVTPSPSIIAGQINANGQVVLINQSGVVVTKGADINAESLVLATSNIADKDFMAGRMVFSGAPNPGAKIINDGNITVRDTGLAGLVAPQVENNGVITARLGQVILAGASAFTLDLYGDRLISLDVTKAVRAVDVGGALVPALVTNRGLILADGGKITLTAQDADALVTQLIDAGGTIRADSVGAAAGTVSISGVGGDITIAGNLLARGAAPGTKGGSVEALTTGTLSVAPSALIDASGAAGGGAVALGTDLARAAAGAADTAAPRAAAVQVAAGARIHADATQAGDAGRVVLLSQKQTDFQGLISVRGGPKGGDGGIAEISSGGVISLGGTVLDTAIDGQSGEVLLDPATLAITGGTGGNAASASFAGATTFGDDGASGISTLSAASLDALGGTIILQAASLISVGAAIGLTNASALTLASLGDITISAAISVATGALEIDAADTLFVGGALSATDITLNDPGTGGITLAAPVIASANLLLQSGGDIGEDGGGFISAAMLAGTATGAAALGASLNTIGVLAGFTGGSLNFQDTSSAIITSALTADSITLVTPNALEIAAPVTASDGDVELVANALGFANTGSITAPANAEIAYAPYTPSAMVFTGSGDALAYFSAGTVALGVADGHEATQVLAIGNESFAGSLLLQASTEVLQEGTLTAGNLNLNAGTSIAIGGLVTTAGVLDLSSAGTIADAGVLSAATIAFGATAFGQGSNASFTAGPITAGLITGSATSLLSLGNLGNAIGALGAITITHGDLLIGDDAPLHVTGPLQAQDISLIDLNPSGIALGAGGSLLAAGNIGIAADALSAAAGATFSASAVTLAPYADTGIDFGGTNAGMLSLAQPVFTAAAGVPSLRIGTGGASLATDGAIAVTAGTLLLNASSINFNSALDTSGLLVLESPGAVAETSLGSVAAPTLIGAGTLGNIGLTSPNNAIGTLGALTLASGGTLALSDSGLLSVPGTITAGGEVWLDGAAGIGISGEIVTGALLLESANGGVTETPGAVIAANSVASLGALGGPASLTAAGNTIASLGAFAASSLAMVDSRALGVTGALAAGNATLAAPGIAFNAPVEVPGTLALISTSGITQTAPITAGTLTSGGATDQGGVVLNANANSIAALGAFSLGSGSFALADAEALSLAGPFSAPAASLAGTSLAITGALSTTGALALAFSNGIAIAGPVNAGLLDLSNSAGTIAEAPGGTITTSMLSGYSSNPGGLYLGQANAISTLSSIADGGALLLNDTAPLTLAGGVSAASASLTAPSLDFTGTLLTPQPLHLATTAGIAEAAGAVISAPSLTGSNTGGNVELASTANTIASLGVFAFGPGNFALDDSAALTLNGPLSGGGATLAAPGLALAGNLLIANALTLSGSAVQQVSGSIVSTALDLALTGDADLAGAGNTIASLAGDAGNVTLTDTGPLAVAGLTGDNILLSAPAINFTGVAAASGILTLDSPGAITQTGGAIFASTLASAGTGLGTTALNQPGNTILNLGGFTASSLSLVDAAALDVIGALSANNAALSAAGISLNAPVAVPGLLTLGGTGGVTQNAAVTAGTLSGSLGGDADLGNAANRIASLSDFSAAGTLSLADAGPLNIAGAVSAAAADLTTNGGITEAANATLAAASLSGSVTGGDVALPGNNSIASLGSFNLGSGAFSLSDTVPLTLNGPLTGATAALTAPSMDLDGDITVTDALTLAGAAAGVLQNAGGITAPILILDTSGTTALTGDANAITRLTGNTGAASLTDQQALTVSSLSAADLGLTAPAIVLGDGIEISGLLALASPGAITQNAAITAGTLSSAGATDGAADFSQTGNVIGTLGAFSASDLAVADSIPLGIAGPVNANLLNLRGPGMDFAGNVTAGTLALSSTGGISQSGGGITAGTLTTGSGGMDGNTVLGGANAVSTLASLTDFGGFTLAAGSPLTLAGSISASNLALSADGIAITGPVNTGILQLSGGGNVLESGAGVITSSTLTTGDDSITGGAALDNPANHITHLGNFAASGGLVLDDAQALEVDGLVQLGGTLALADPGSVTQTGGTLAAGGLATTGSGIGGQLAFNQSGNAISALGDLTVAGSADITDAAPLTLTGAINIGGDDFTLADTGPITQTGGILSTSLLNASASALSLPDDNAIGALGSIAVTGDLLVNGASNLTGAVAAGNATFISAGTFGLSGTADITGALTILAAGDITQTAGSLSAATLAGSGGSLASFGVLGGTADFATLASFTLADSLFTLENAGPLTLTGPLTANTVRITATGQLVLDGSAGGGLFITGGLAPPGAAPPPSATQSELAVLPGVTGGASLSETGTFNINTGQTAVPATIFLVNAGGTIAFDRTAGLRAPDVDVILVAGPQGSVSGNVNAAQLEIYSAGLVNLTGMIDGIAGGAAAALVTSVPGPSPQYQFNAYEIGVLNGGTLPLEILQESAKTTTTANPVNKLDTPIHIADPLENFDISQRKRRRLNKNVQLPGIATHDF